MSLRLMAAATWQGPAGGSAWFLAVFQVTLITEVSSHTSKHTRHCPVSGSQTSLWLLQLQGIQGASRGQGPQPSLSGSFPLWYPGAQS